MKTRFDNTVMWVTSDGSETNIRDMETTHLLNTVKMFIQKPYRIVSILIKDVERYSQHHYPEVWTPTHQGASSVVTQSIGTITSMSKEQLVDYALGSPLCAAMIEELTRRGVNVSNVLEIFGSEDQE